MVADEEEPGFGHLVGHFQIALAQCLLGDVRLDLLLAVHIHGSVFQNIHGLAGAGKNPLDQQLIAQVKSHQIALFKVGTLDGHHNLPLF